MGRETCPDSKTDAEDNARSEAGRTPIAPRRVGPTADDLARTFLHLRYKCGRRQGSTGLVHDDGRV